MEVNIFSKLKQPSMDDSKFLVFAYMNEHQRILFASDCANNPYYNIPEIVINICLLYFHIAEDKWDQDSIGDNININGNRIDKNDVGYQTAYLHNIVSFGVHSWRFKINTIGYYKTLLGILKKSRSSLQLNSPFTSRMDAGYAYILGSGSITDPHTIYSAHARYPQCYSGDIIEMILDFNDLSLSYKINGIDQGKVFQNIQHTEYRAAITFSNHGDSVTLLYYNAY